ncbi:MAG: trehalose-6-phosphate synthase, partial [Solirubrobacteraceae bacterium]
RQDVPEYAEYLEKIEALVAVVNHRHGTPDWMPIDLRLRENLEEAIAAYKHYDVMMVNAMFDGMNLVAKEGPLVNERNGVSILSENTGAHEELGEFALSVNPFDVQELADAIYDGLLSNDIVGFHTRSYRWNFLQCCRDLMGYDVDFEGGVVWHHGGHETWVRAYPLPIDAEATCEIAARPRVDEYEAELERRQREHLIIRVDRADLSKNVLRGFAAFDLFVEQHPEFRENVTFVAQLMPSRTDVPEYAEYLERIEALVAVVNHRHGTPDWMPIQLKLRDNLDEAMASYKHYDVLLVNAMFDGMNLVAKEGPLVNEVDGVSILSENTGAHEELGEYALSVNPFDIQELADSIHAALTMDREERARRMRGLKDIVTARDPGDWIDDQLADIRKKGTARAQAGR